MSGFPVVGDPGAVDGVSAFMGALTIPVILSALYISLDYDNGNSLAAILSEVARIRVPNQSSQVQSADARCVSPVRRPRYASRSPLRACARAPPGLVEVAVL